MAIVGMVELDLLDLPVPLEASTEMDGAVRAVCHRPAIGDRTHARPALNDARSSAQGHGSVAAAVQRAARHLRRPWLRVVTGETDPLRTSPS